MDLAQNIQSYKYQHLLIFYYCAMITDIKSSGTCCSVEKCYLDPFYCFGVNIHVKKVGHTKENA